MAEPKRVLLVDDDQALLYVMREALESAGYYATVLDRSIDVLGAVHAQQPDLVVLDYVMPGRTGGEVAAWLRGQGCMAPLLFVTGLGVTGDDIGGHRLLRKPFDMNTLIQTVHELIGPAL